MTHQPPSSQQPGNPYVGGVSAPPPAPKKKRRGCGCLLVGLVALLVISGIVSAVSGSKKDSKASSSATASSSPTTSARSTPSSSEATSSESSSAPSSSEAASSESSSAPSNSEAASSESNPSAADTSSTGDELSGGESAAKAAAANYLDTMPFSKRGLIAQLSSSAGDGYSLADATAAVNSLTDVDWNAQAAKAAQQYLSTMPMSCQALKEQLSSDFGDKFTQAQANYGASQTSVCR